MKCDESSDNYVFLRGRLAATPTVKDLPSGDTLVVFRVTVDRPEGERGRVDSLDCVTTRTRVRRSLERAAPGATVEVTGAVRRRFWRGPSGPASRYAVDVVSLRVVPTGRPAGASRAPKRVSG